MLLLIAALPILAAPLPVPLSDYVVQAPNRLSEAMGVSLHPRGDVAHELDRIAAAGLRFVRIDVTWSAVERTRGSFDWAPVEALVQAIGARGMRPLLILGYSNPQYEPLVPSATGGEPLVPAPMMESSRAAFARFAALAARRYHRYRPLLELWNEPNSDRFWPPKASPADYIALARQACGAIRHLQPDAEVIAPGFGNNPTTPAVDSPFMAAVARSPLAGCLSAISVHPYLFMGAIDDAPRWWRQFRKTLGPAAAKPLVASEWGMSTYARRLDELDQASYLVRMALYDNAAGVRATIWYDWRDDGSDRDEPEHHFGLTWPDGEPKPAYVALRTMTRALRAYPRMCLIRQGQAVRAIFFGSGPARRMVVWNITPSGRTPGAASEPLIAQLPAGAIVGPVVDVLGQPTAFSADPRQVRITRGQPPFYVDYTAGSADECAESQHDG